MDGWMDGRSEHFAVLRRVRRDDDVRRPAFSYRRDDRQFAGAGAAGDGHVPSGQVASPPRRVHRQPAPPPPAPGRAGTVVGQLAVGARPRRGVQNDLVDEVDVGLDVARRADNLRVLTDLVESLGGHLWWSTAKYSNQQQPCRYWNSYAI